MDCFYFFLLLIIPFSCSTRLNPNQNSYTLRQVQVITRHGARSPFGDIPNNEAVWNCTLDLLEFPHNFIESVPSVKVPRVYRKSYLYGEEVLPGNCYQGELTIKGYQQHFNLGESFRKYYIEELEFLDPNFNQEQIYVRSTDVPRTFQSAEAQFLGLYPPKTRSGDHLQVIEINTIESELEYMTPNTLCPAFVDFCNEFQNTTYWQDVMDSYNPLKEYLQQCWNSTSLPWWIGVFGILESRLYNGVPWPPCINTSTYEQIESIAVWQVTTLYQDKTYATLGIGKLISELYSNMQRNINGTLDPKWLLYSGHDITIAFLLSSFGIWNSSSPWPTYASHIVLELYQNEAEDFFVQFKYNGELVLIPGCESEMCSFSDFSDVALSLFLTPKEWNRVCNYYEDPKGAGRRSFGLSGGIRRPKVNIPTDWESAIITEYFC